MVATKWKMARYMATTTESRTTPEKTINIGSNRKVRAFTALSTSLVEIGNFSQHEVQNTCRFPHIDHSTMGGNISPGSGAWQWSCLSEYCR